jgi:Uma2 family endonuclease
VLSEATRVRDVVAKRSLYLDAGIDEYWIVDGNARSITVVRLGHEDVVAMHLLRWSPLTVSEPLELDVRAMFDAALG